MNRFWDKVDKKGKDDCWNWIGAIHKTGYVYFKLNRKAVRANRLAYELTYGKFSKELDVLHTCDNRKCVNPNHLYLGTQQDNINDMMRRNRHGKSGQVGEDHHSAKLNTQDVYEIKYFLGIKMKHKEIAKAYGVSRQAITDINTNRNWSKVV